MRAPERVKEAVGERHPAAELTIVLECLDAASETTSRRVARVLEPDADDVLVFYQDCAEREFGRGTKVPRVLVELAAAALICLDPGHGTAPGVGRSSSRSGRARSS